MAHLQIVFVLIYYILVSGFVWRQRYPVVSFLFLIYTLQFWPIFMGIFMETIVFWPIGDYTFDINSVVFSSIVTVFLITISGFFLFCLLSFLFIPNNVFSNNYRVFNCTKLIPNLVSWALLFFAFFLLFSDFYFGLSLSFPGYHLFISLLLACIFASSLIKRSVPILLFCGMAIFLYSSFQVTKGDRDFVTIIVALGLYYFTFFNLSRRAVILLFICCLLIVSIGVSVSILRQDSDITFSSFMYYLAFNSWLGVIKPFLDMLKAETLNLEWLFGETYIYLLLSFAPSMVYEAFEASKPFDAHNPAYWYFVPGGGGMHAVGVALKNFGLLGVFLQPIVFSFVLVFINRLCFRVNNFYCYVFFIGVALVLMKAIWYSLISFVNGITFCVIFVVLIFILKGLLPTKWKKRGFANGSGH